MHLSGSQVRALDEERWAKDRAQQSLKELEAAAERVKSEVRCGAMKVPACIVAFCDMLSML